MSRLEITQETMGEILSADDPVTGPDAGTEPEGEAGVPEEPAVEADRFEVSSPLGMRLVLSWAGQLGVEALPPGYADIREVLADAVHPMRAHQLCSERAGLDRGGCRRACSIRGIRLRRAVCRGGARNLWCRRAPVSRRALAPSVEGDETIRCPGTSARWRTTSVPRWLTRLPARLHSSLD